MEKVSQPKIRVKKESDFHKVQKVNFDKDSMILKIDNKIFEFKLKDISLKLLKASKKERDAYKIICSGYGINWPLIDEDLSIDGLIKISKESKRKK
jgi:hypothetical protein